MKTLEMKATALIIMIGLVGSGCSSWSWGKRETGAIVGAVAGAAIGAAGAKRKTKGALIGAAAGALAGGLVGWYLDKQEQELQARMASLEAAQHQQELDRVSTRRQADTLVVSFPSNLMFDTGSSQLHPGSQKSLQEVAGVLKRYPHSDVTVAGHTDSSGDPTRNQRLSEQRADAVKSFLTAEGLDSSRIIVRGYGATQPVASNATPEGRQQNRRVEIQIKPREEALDQEYREQG